MSSADDKKLGEMLVGCMPTLFAFVRLRVGDRETTNEILQEVSLRALTGKGPRDPDRFLYWCCGIARHVIGMEWRRCRRLRAVKTASLGRDAVTRTLYPGHLTRRDFGP